MGVFFTFITGLLMAFEPITDNDVFWHLVIGKWIDTNHAIPTQELFSWYGTSQGYKWTSHEWLTEWIMYKVGPIGCIVLMLIIFLGLYFLMYKMLKLNAKKLFDFKWLYLLLMTVFFKVTGPRPYIISLLFFAYLVYILFSYIDDEKPIFKKLIWTIPIMQILWVNLHGGSSSLPYLFIIGVLICDLILKIIPNASKRWGEFRLTKEKRKTLIILLGLVLLASLINPTTYNILLYPFTNMADTNMIDLILEWKSPSFHGLLGIYIFIMIAFPLFNMILSEKKYKLHEVAFLAVMFYMCLKSQRFVGMFGIYSTWLVGKYFFVTDDIYEGIRKPFKKFEKIITYSFSCLLVLVVCLVGYKQIKSFDKVMDNHGYYSDESILKVIELKPKRMYNDFGQGGYLLYKLDEYNALDNTKLFIYGLGDVFSNNILPDATKLSNVSGNPKEIIEKYDFDLILTSKQYPLHYYLDELDDWNLIYEDDMGYIYTKNPILENENNG
ncbi:MAG: hypothetical protein NC181_01785 [Clostridium sp.]|nr:hypothetical protein [Clostridium sp.]MCM1444038.1 hypothetical protein [Candidatus Amulumruptor caecigallinarius]